MANLVLNGKTYYGAGLANGIAKYVDRSAGVPAGFSEATSSVRSDKDYYRLTGKLNLPIVSTSATECACPGSILSESDAQFTVRIDPKADLATRTDLNERFQAYVATAEVEAMFLNLQNLTGT